MSHDPLPAPTGLSELSRRTDVRVGLVGAVLVAAVVGAVVGRQSAGTETIEVVGMGQWLPDHQAVNLGSADRSYGWVAEVRWTGQDGWHEGGRPRCVPEDGVTVPLRFTAVPVEVDGVQWRQVVVIHCD